MASSRIVTAISIVLVYSMVHSPAKATDWFVANGSCGNGSAATPFCRIQDGINAAQSGDQVVVFEGVYRGTGNTDLIFPPREIAVFGNATCIIDCEHLVRGVSFISDNGQSSTLQGFTIRNGNVGFEGGGGILVSNASPRIIGNIIEDCVAQGSGGGVETTGSGSPLILNNTIRGNRSVSGAGGGIAAGSSGEVTIHGNVIQENHAANGGGILASGMVTIQNSTIELNVAEAHFGGGVYLAGGSKLLVTGCKILRNSAPDTGGGIYLPTGTATIVNTLIAGNGTVAPTPFYGGGFGCCKANENGRPIIVNCIITNNKAKDAGGGVYLNLAGTAPHISNTVFAYNESRKWNLRRVRWGPVRGGR